mgnify:FL=1
MGKEDKRYTLPQEDINELIYQASLKYENVVRLKGGDPFVFGRGGEEALYLYERNIEFEIILESLQLLQFQRMQEFQ